MNKSDAKRLNKPFVITTCCCDDIATMLINDRGIDEDKAIEIALKLSDYEMSLVADRMASTYVENSFWIDLGILLDELAEEQGWKSEIIEPESAEEKETESHE